MFTQKSVAKSSGINRTLIGWRGTCFGVMLITPQFCSIGTWVLLGLVQSSVRS